MATTKLSLNGRTALITGGAGGIGGAVATALAARGANVVVTDIWQSALEQATATIPPAQLLAAAADVTNANAMRALVDGAVDRFGRLDIVFANAGIGPNPPSTLRTTDPADFANVVNVDLLGVWNTVQPALEHVITNQGHILLTASVYAFLNGTINGPYAASKAAVEQLGRALRTELSMHGASAGVLYPGWVATRIASAAYGGDPHVTALVSHVYKGPLGTAISPERIARGVVPAIERRAARVMIPGRWIPYSVLRGALNPLLDAAIVRDRTAIRLLRELETARLARS